VTLLNRVEKEVGVPERLTDAKFERLVKLFGLDQCIEPISGAESFVVVVVVVRSCGINGLSRNEPMSRIVVEQSLSQLDLDLGGGYHSSVGFLVDLDSQYFTLI
jgi:hypothetical protein